MVRLLIGGRDTVRDLVFAQTFMYPATHNTQDITVLYFLILYTKSTTLQQPQQNTLPYKRSKTLQPAERRQYPS